MSNDLTKYTYKIEGDSELFDNLTPIEITVTDDSDFSAKFVARREYLKIVGTEYGNAITIKLIKIELL